MISTACCLCDYVTDDSGCVTQTFLQTSETRYNDLVKLYCTMMSDVDKMLHYFGENPTMYSYKTVCDTLAAFLRTLLGSAARQGFMLASSPSTGPTYPLDL